MNFKTDTNKLTDTDYTIIFDELEKILNNPIPHGTYSLEIFFRDKRVQRFTVSQTMSTLLPVS